MTSNTKHCKTKSSGLPKQFELVIRTGNGSRERSTFHASFDDLARALHDEVEAGIDRLVAGQFLWCGNIDFARLRARWIEVNVGAFTDGGKTINAPELYDRGRILDKAFRRFARRHRPARYTAGYARRDGPVHGIHKWRGGPYSKGPHFIGERRLNGYFVADEGEVEVRAARTPKNLGNDRDDRRRSVERCWKRQHHGDKAWCRGC